MYFMEDITLVLTLASFVLYGAVCLLKTDNKPIAFFATVVSVCAIASLLTENALAGFDYFMIFPLIVVCFGSIVASIKKELDNGI